MRSRITFILIRLAMKTCIEGFCYDHLINAYRCEGGKIRHPQDRCDADTNNTE